MYVLDGEEARRVILDGVRHAQGTSIPMPAYRDVLSATEVDDLVAAFKVISGMAAPPGGTAARRGEAIARRWECFFCHGPAGSGGVSNPGSLAGYVPGWYGPDFRDLVRDREEFVEWVRTGTLARLDESRLASFFLRRQRTPMPAYARLTDAEIDDLWSYTGWLEATEGGARPAAASDPGMR
jgi:mono/diheme cytochrome c family protein